MLTHLINILGLCSSLLLLCLSCVLLVSVMQNCSKGGTTVIVKSLNLLDLSAQ
jgi:hypothetical protein